MYATTPEQRRAVKVRELAATLYTERCRYLRSIARKQGGRGVDPDEAVQEAFALFIAHYDPQGGSPPLAWLTLTAKRDAEGHVTGEQECELAKALARKLGWQFRGESAPDADAG